MSNNKKNKKTVTTNDTPDTSAPLVEILEQSIGALNTATKKLESAYANDKELNNLPYKYVIPEMTIDIKLTLSYQKGKGLFASLIKRGSQSSEMTSCIGVTVKAVPVSQKQNEDLAED